MEELDDGLMVDFEWLLLALVEDSVLQVIGLFISLCQSLELPVPSDLDLFCLVGIHSFLCCFGYSQGCSGGIDGYMLNSHL